MSSKNDLLTVWAKWTGDPIPEVRHRIRVLSENDLFPVRSAPLTYRHFARWLLAAVGSDTHKDAAENVARMSKYVCRGVTRGGIYDLAKLPLLDAITAALKPPRSLGFLQISIEPGHVDLRVDTNGHSASDWNEIEYSYAPTRAREQASTFPIVTSRTVDGSLIERVLAELQLQDDSEERSN